MGSVGEGIEAGLKRESPDAMTKGLAARYRSLFSSGAGTEVLADMICRLGLFATLETEDDVARHNYAVELLAFAGVLKHDPKQIMRALLNIAE